MKYKSKINDKKADHVLKLHNAELQMNHYKIATYDSAAEHDKSPESDEIAQILYHSPEEEKKMNGILNELAKNKIKRTKHIAL